MDFRIGNGVLALLHLLCLIFGIVVAALPGSVCSLEVSLFGFVGMKREMNFFTFSLETPRISVSGDSLEMCEGAIQHVIRSGRAEVVIICIFAGISAIIRAVSVAVPTLLPKVLRTISSVMLYVTLCLSVLMGIMVIVIVVVPWGEDCVGEGSLKQQGAGFGAGMFMSFLITVVCIIGCVINCKTVKEPSLSMANDRYQAFQPREEDSNTHQGGEMTGKNGLL